MCGDATQARSVLCFIKFLRRSMCKFHRVYRKPQGVPIPSVVQDNLSKMYAVKSVGGGLGD